MLFSILGGRDLKTIFISLLLQIPIIVFALCLHETAHGFVAWKCGDNTAYNMGRLTLNPTKHLDLFGTILMLIFGFGFAKPVPINVRNFRDPKKGMAISAAAGPISNLIVGILSAALYGFFSALADHLYFTGTSITVCTALSWIAVFMSLSSVINFLYAFFNLIPVPPFDGSRIALLFLPYNTYFKIMRYEREIMYGLLILLFLLSRLGFSPFQTLAYGASDLISEPVYDLSARLLLA